MTAANADSRRRRLSSLESSAREKICTFWRRALALEICGAVVTISQVMLILCRFILSSLFFQI